MRKLMVLVLWVGLVCNARAASLISLDFSGEMSDLERQTFIDAADFWNSAITGYLLTSDTNGLPTPHSLTVTASVVAIDGPGRTLGSAGPSSVSYYDNDPLTPNPTKALYYARTGVIEFDAADVAALAANNTLYGAVLHEMGHVLGIGTLWELNNNVNDTTYQLYTVGSGRYTGANALAQWRNEFSLPLASFVPVERGGGAGTADGHWNENDFGSGNTGIASVDNGLDFADELMTGWTTADKFFLSRTTLGALEDLGYQVDYSKAGIIDHVVTIPEWSSLTLCFGTVLVALRRHRPLH